VADGAAQARGRRELLAWAFYDWGNSAFAVTVMAGFFPVFFKQYWSAGADVSVSTLKLGGANSVASFVIAVFAPLLGAIADRGAGKKRLLAVFTALGVLTTAGLTAVGKGEWFSAALLYTAASVGFAGAIVFYDSLIVAVASPEQSDRASALGYALGYLGGGVLFALNVAMVQKPALFGLADAAAGVRASFLLVALWWAVFTLPLMLYVREPSGGGRGVLGAMRDGLEQLQHTVRRVRTLRPVFMFLCAYWLYIDGVDTVIRMAVDYGLSLGFPSSALMTALLITQFVGFPAALVFGRLGTKIGSKRAILIGIAVYVGITVWGYYMDSVREFYALAIVVGLVQGGVQALSRSLFSRMVPAGEAAEFFGLYNMLGKFAAIIGPALMGAVSMATGSARLSILSIALLLLAGGALLWLVDERAAEAQAARAAAGAGQAAGTGLG
jgi:UMF1 family MFS transporter